MDEFRLATPEFLAACRWVVMAERMVPGLEQAREVVAAPVSAENAMAKLHAGDQVRQWEAWLFPEGDDG